MLPVYIEHGTPASQVDAENLNEARNCHIKVRCFRLYKHLRSLGLNRVQCNEIRNRFDSFLFDKLDIDSLIEKDEIADKVRICQTGFILPVEAKPTIVNIANAFFNQPEMKIAKSLCQVCPSYFIL